MRPVKDAHGHITVFISHSSEDNDEAKEYQDLLREEGFDVWQYGRSLDPGRDIATAVEREIRSRHFFVLIVGEHSREKLWVQRELGLALKTRKANGGYRPLVIPLFSKKVEWSNDNVRLDFPTRDYHKDKPGRPFSLSVRGLNKNNQPHADSDDVLLSYLKPSLIISRMDFHDRRVFYDTGVFKLYEELFPIKEERDDPEDIAHWVLESDIGEPRPVKFRNIEFTYQPDSRYCILLSGGKAIGLAFLTYDYTYRITYGNYIGVQKSWRSHDIAGAFAKKIEETFREEGLFLETYGTVFEVETFDKNEVERVIQYLERIAGSKRKFKTPADEQTIRRFLRVCWYQWLGYNFFIDEDAGAPIVCRSPCLDPDLPQNEWKGEEEEYWLMWKSAKGARSDRNDKELWEDCIRCVYIEILAKALVERFPNKKGEAYWGYANCLIENVIEQNRNTEIGQGKFLHRRASDLHARWINLGMECAV